MLLAGRCAQLDPSRRRPVPAAERRHGELLPQRVAQAHRPVADLNLPGAAGREYRQTPAALDAGFDPHDLHQPRIGVRHPDSPGSSRFQLAQLEAPAEAPHAQSELGQFPEQGLRILPDTPVVRRTQYELAQRLARLGGEGLSGKAPQHLLGPGFQAGALVH